MDSEVECEIVRLITFQELRSEVYKSVQKCKVCKNVIWDQRLARSEV